MYGNLHGKFLPSTDTYLNENDIKTDRQSILIDGNINKTLSALNKYSYYQYKVDENNRLYKSNKINKKGSQLYSQAIDRCIGDNNSEIIIRFSETGTNYVYTISIDVKNNYGGGCTIFNGKETDPSEIYVFFMKKGLSDKGKWNIPAEQVLMHEIVGHADPIAAGGSRDNENALENENNVLEQLNLSKQKRVVNKWHTAR